MIFLLYCKVIRRDFFRFSDVEEESMDCENEESSNFQDRFPIKTKADFDSLCKTVESSKDKRSIVVINFFFVL